MDEQDRLANKTTLIADGRGWNDEEKQDLGTEEVTGCPTCGGPIGFICSRHPPENQGPWPCACHGDPDNPRMGQCPCDVAVCATEGCPYFGLPITYRGPAEKEKAAEPPPPDPFGPNHHIFISQYNPPSGPR